MAFEPLAFLQVPFPWEYISEHAGVGRSDTSSCARRPQQRSAAIGAGLPLGAALLPWLGVSSRRELAQGAAGPQPGTVATALALGRWRISWRCRPWCTAVCSPPPLEKAAAERDSVWSLLATAVGRGTSAASALSWMGSWPACRAVIRVVCVKDLVLSLQAASGAMVSDSPPQGALRAQEVWVPWFAVYVVTYHNGGSWVWYCWCYLN